MMCPDCQLFFFFLVLPTVLSCCYANHNHSSSCLSNRSEKMLPIIPAKLFFLSKRVLFIPEPHQTP